MRASFLSLAFVLTLYGCGRDAPVEDPQARMDKTRQVEKTEAGAPPTPADTAADTQRFTDTSLTEIVRTALQSDSSLDPGKIEVENRNGDVALRGSVASEEQKERAGRIVGSVGGVRTVTNNLAVDPSAATGTTSGSPLPDPSLGGPPPPPPLVGN